MCKRYKSIVVTILHKSIKDLACHFGNLIEPAIRHGEQCEIGCPERCLQPHEVICYRIIREQISDRQAHKARSCACSLCLPK